MRIILLKDVPGVGKRHDVIEAKGGHADFLIRKKSAQYATPQALEALEKRKKEILVGREVQMDLLLKNLEEVKNKTITIESKVNEKGHLFSAIHKEQIINQLKKEEHADISEEFIVLEKPIKEIGEFEIPVIVHSTGGKTLKSSFKLIVNGSAKG